MYWLISRVMAPHLAHRPRDLYLDEDQHSLGLNLIAADRQLRNLDQGLDELSRTGFHGSPSSQNLRGPFSHFSRYVSTKLPEEPHFSVKKYIEDTGFHRRSRSQPQSQ